MQANDCSTAYSVYPTKDPILGADFLWKIIDSARQKELLDFWTSAFNTYGKTFTISSLRGSTIFTTEPENFKALYATRFDDFAVAPPRARLVPLLGTSMFVSDGTAWSHSRRIMRPIFTKDQVSDLASVEEHMQAFFKCIPVDGSTFDLQDLFHRLTMDTATEFLFGESTQSLSLNISEEQKRLQRDLNLFMTDAIDRVRYMILYPFFKKKEAAEAVRNVHRTVDEYARRAFERSKKQQEAGYSDDTETSRYLFLDEIARETGDIEKTRSEALSLLLAGRDTTATLLSNFWFLLARSPLVWKKLMNEVDELQGQIPTYEWLRNARYLKNCVLEAHRLYPAIPLLPPRSAVRDTVFPSGGGPDGTSPLYVAKDTKVIINIQVACRQKDVFGDDAEAFNPDRWDNIRPGWNYIPFAGGPRICLGRKRILKLSYNLI
ncbi:hypothetical protein BT93_L5092 [Corymbia citriodora subsp. variegata]|uniref:Cytochrome P450 n=1 Tax=Corymbia citriodora subsp. variegata TaxID=360336 RepID=A0A8T0CFF7_CORYI|nr:hypothetical protein BT93_L5092 [Corymbia citriodora subsp. variegata]